MQFRSINLSHSAIDSKPLNAELNPIRHLLALAGAHHFVHVSRLRVELNEPKPFILIVPSVMPHTAVATMHAILLTTTLVFALWVGMFFPLEHV
jgi:hypothetical protein